MRIEKEHILRFIDRFTGNGKRQEVIETFSCGCCYWFAETLLQSFRWRTEQDLVAIVYDPIINHFACQIDDRIYDITGDITDDTQYNWIKWNDYKWEDQLHTSRIMRDCIYFGGGIDND